MLQLENYIKGFKSTWIIFFIQHRVDIDLLLSTGTEYLVYLKDNIKNVFKRGFIGYKEIQDKNQISYWN